MPANPPTDDDTGESSDTTTSDTPTVPVFYPVPEAAAERAVRRLQQYRDADPEELTFPGRDKKLRDYVLDEVRQESVIYVDGQPLEVWASEHADGVALDDV